MYIVLEQSLEHMVINVFIDIESCKYVKHVAEVNIPWNGHVILEDQEEVHHMD